ncbi:MAG: oligosaccharide flippase family protein [Chloroflexi bacterium]|nr:oligosaccharide flippase family protein [Chloroflexota bacterium]
MAAALGGQAALVVTGPLLVRMLGVEARGELALMYVVVLFVSQLGMMGMPSAVAYFIARDKVSARALVHNFGRQYLLLSVIAAAATVGLLSVAVWNGYRLATPVIEVTLVGVGIVLFMWMFVLSAALQGEQRFKHLAAARLAAPLCYLAFVVGLYAAHYHGSVAVVLALLLLSWGVSTLMCYVFLQPVDKHSPPGIAPDATNPRQRVLVRYASLCLPGCSWGCAASARWRCSPWGIRVCRRSPNRSVSACCS